MSNEAPAAAPTPPGSLVEALAKLQGRLPKVTKDKEAKIVPRDGGPVRKYPYAGLADLSDEILPLLSELGLAWICRPMLNADKQLVLDYRLWHVSGEMLEGQIPLPAGVSPQVLGSSITYYRRYTLTAVTGLAPDVDDDDGRLAATAGRPVVAPYREQAANDRADYQTANLPGTPERGSYLGRSDPPSTPSRYDPAQDLADEAEAARARVVKFNDLLTQIKACTDVAEVDALGIIARTALEGGHLNAAQHSGLGTEASKKKAALRAQLEGSSK